PPGRAAAAGGRGPRGRAAWAGGPTGAGRRGGPPSAPAPNGELIRSAAVGPPVLEALPDVGWIAEGPFGLPAGPQVSIPPPPTFPGLSFPFAENGFAGVVNGFTGNGLPPSVILGTVIGLGTLELVGGVTGCGFPPRPGIGNEAIVIAGMLEIACGGMIARPVFGTAVAVARVGLKTEAALPCVV